jgi:tetratricopeptide (TPR) repeat protein
MRRHSLARARKIRPQYLGLLALVWTWLGTCLLLAHSSNEPQKFEVRGQVRLAQWQKPHRLVAYVALSGNTSPYYTYTWTDFSGNFKFKGVPPGSYSLSVEIRRRGEKRLTVEISPSLADPKGRIYQIVTVEPSRSLATRQKPDVVSLQELSIPDKARRLSLEAEKKLTKGEIERGVTLLERAVNLAPHFVAAINRLGTIFHMQKQYAKAEDYFREALEEDPKAYAPLVNLGGTLLAVGRLQEALAFNQRAVAARPMDALANAQLGLSYVSLKEDEKAVGYLVRTKQLDPLHFTFPQLALADIYHRQKKPELALQELQEFVKLHPDDTQAKLIRKQIEHLGRE